MYQAAPSDSYEDAKSTPEIRPGQPYMALRTDNFRKILQQSLGIAQFYTFSLKEAADVLQAVPDRRGSSVREKNQLRSFIQGNSTAGEKIAAGSRRPVFLEYVFCRDSVYAKDSQPKSWVSTDIRYRTHGIILQNRLWKRTNLEGTGAFFWKAMRSVWTGKKGRDGAGWRYVPQNLCHRRKCADGYPCGRNRLFCLLHTKEF